MPTNNFIQDFIMSIRAIFQSMVLIPVTPHKMTMQCSMIVCKCVNLQRDSLVSNLGEVKYKGPYRMGCQRG